MCPTESGVFNWWSTVCRAEYFTCTQCIQCVSSMTADIMMMAEAVVHLSLNRFLLGNSKLSLNNLVALKLTALQSLRLRWDTAPCAY